MVEWLNKGLMDNSQLWHFFGVRKYLGGELTNSPVAELLNKGLMSVRSPNGRSVNADARPLTSLKPL